MTRILFRLVLLSLCVLLGWAFGYIKVPYIERNDAFWVGFVGCMGMIGFVITLFQILNKNKTIKLFETSISPLNASQNPSLFKNKFLVSITIIALFFICLLSIQRTQSLNKKLKLAHAALEDLKSNVSLEEQKINISLLLDLINSLDSTKVNVHDPSKVDQMMERIVSLSSSFKIYKEWDFANNVNQSLSSERGLLLLALVKTKLDSNYFNKIKAHVSFYGADLRNADLHDLDLSGINLKYANLEYANLKGINLNNANLNGANLVGVNLNQATLVGANLISAKLNWAKVNEVNFHKAKLDSANFSNATVQKSQLTHASMIHALICNALFNESNLDHCLLMYTNVSFANLSKTILTHTDINFINFTNTILNDAIVPLNWKEQLVEKENIGINSMFEEYHIVCDSTSIQDSMFYRIIRKIK